MTRTTNARVAGFTFLIYIAAAMTEMVLSRGAAAGEGTAARLASVAQHLPAMRMAFLLDIVSCCCAFVLAVTLYAITRDQDRDVARLAMTFRVAEGVTGVVSLPTALGRMWLATASGPGAPDPAAVNALGAVILKLPNWSTNIGATFFAVGSTLFAYLLLRGRIVPAALAWLGLLASVLVVVCLPLEAIQLLRGPMTELMWLPMLAFELTFALWLMIKGAAVPAGAR